MPLLMAATPPPRPRPRCSSACARATLPCWCAPAKKPPPCAVRCNAGAWPRSTCPTKTRCSRARKPATSCTGCAAWPPRRMRCWCVPRWPCAAWTSAWPSCTAWPPTTKPSTSAASTCASCKPSGTARACWPCCASRCTASGWPPAGCNSPMANAGSPTFCIWPNCCKPPAATWKASRPSSAGWSARSAKAPARTTSKWCAWKAMPIWSSSSPSTKARGWNTPWSACRLAPAFARSAANTSRPPACLPMAGSGGWCWS